MLRQTSRSYCTAFHDGVEVTKLNGTSINIYVSDPSDLLLCDVGDVVKNTSGDTIPWGAVVVHKDGTFTYYTATEEYILTEDDVFVSFRYIA